MTPRSRRPRGGDEEHSAKSSRRAGRPASVSHGEEHASQTLRGGRSTAAGGGRAASSPSGSSSKQPSNVPHGFRDFQHFKEFAAGFRDRMRERYPDLEMGFQGSSVTGRGADTGKAFDEGRVSDYDIAITGDSINDAARANGVPFRGDGVSTGPLSERDLERLGLASAVSDASAGAGRDVHVMIFRTMNDAVSRKPTIRVWF